MERGVGIEQCPEGFLLAPDHPVERADQRLAIGECGRIDAFAALVSKDKFLIRGFRHPISPVFIVWGGDCAK